MRVVLNGEMQTLPDGLTVADLIAQLGLNQRRIAIEVNRQIITRETYTVRAIADNDEVEIVHFVGGG
jgi:thiamine biosynthesis protein ThiS